jgi:peptidyl-tRNA hydrolase, PTH1 family
MAACRLLVGLGNPGPDYVGTRHNLGFDLAERLAAATRRPWLPRGRALLATGERGGTPFVLARPTTYMNNSGRAVRDLLDELGEGTELLVACDDFHLPLGSLRCRAGGSDGGQKGLASVIALLPGREVPRLRMGIGEPPERVAGEDFVLQRFRRSEQDSVRAMLDAAEPLVLRWLEDGDLPRLINEANANRGQGSR